MTTNEKLSKINANPEAKNAFEMIVKINSSNPSFNVEFAIEFVYNRCFN